MDDTTQRFIEYLQRLIDKFESGEYLLGCDTTIQINLVDSIYQRKPWGELRQIPKLYCAEIKFHYALGERSTTSNGGVIDNGGS